MKIKQQISKLNGLDRTCSIGQIAYMDFDIEEAKIRFDVTIPSLGITQSIWTVISNSNKVTEQGLMITRDYVKSLYPKDNKILTSNPPKEKETKEEYEARIDEHYQSELEKGIPEFTFWWESSKKVNLEEALKQGILLLDKFKTFG